MDRSAFLGTSVHLVSLYSVVHPAFFLPFFVRFSAALFSNCQHACTYVRLVLLLRRNIIPIVVGLEGDFFFPA